MSQKSDIPMNAVKSLATKDHDRHDDLEAASTPAIAPATTAPVPSLWGIPLKYISLVTLAVQNSTLTIVMHHSRISTPPSETYSAATAVLMTEILKGLISLIIAFTRVDEPALLPGQRTAERPLFSRVNRLRREIFSPDCWKLSIPAILYVVQNNLQYVAVSNLPAATFQVTYQMKILTTAIFSVLLLRKRLTSNQWLSLFCLALGVGIVQIQAGGQTNPVGNQPDQPSMYALKGFVAVTAACFTSGLAGVYFEKVLKNSQTDLWVRNVQLSFFSLLPALAPVIFSPVYRADTTVSGFISTLFRNFGGWAWATVLIQVLGGLITALVIRYSDNILKGFATSLSIVISFMASVALFSFHISLPFRLGSSVVLIATWLYNQPPKKTSHSSTDSLSWTKHKDEKLKADDLDQTLLLPGSPHPTIVLTPVSSSTSLSSFQRDHLPSSR